MQDTEQMFRSQLRDEDAREERAAHVARAARGFTLIELMVVVAIIAISATITYSSIQTNQWTNAADHFAEDLTGHLIRARDLAIDEQVPVEVQLGPNGAITRYLVQDFNTDNDYQEEFASISRATYGGSQLDDRICVLGAYPLLYAPSQAANAAGNIPQVPCPGVTDDSQWGGTEHTIYFQPDGSYWVENLDNAEYTDWGWTVVVQDGRGTSPIYYLIDIFPTGVIRMHPNISNASE